MPQSVLRQRGADHREPFVVRVKAVVVLRQPGEYTYFFKKKVLNGFTNNLANQMSHTRSPGQAKLPDVAMVQFWSVPPLTVMPAKRSSEMDLRWRSRKLHIPCMFGERCCAH